MDRCKVMEMARVSITVRANSRSVMTGQVRYIRREIDT